MATLVSTLYPPLIETFMPAFQDNESASVSFSFSPYNSLSEVQRIHISLVSQDTNQSAFKTTDIKSVPNGTAIINNIWIVPITGTNNNSYLKIDKENNTCTIKINPSYLKSGKFVTSSYYKVQIRLDNSTASFRSGENIISKYLIDERGHFSEWSSVCLIKAIPSVDLWMTDFDIFDSSNQTTVIRTVQAGTVPFAGRLIFENSDQITDVNEETLQKYKITVQSTDGLEILDSTKWIYPTNINKIYWLSDLTNGIADNIYDVIIEIVTKNQYSFKKTYQIKIANYDSLQMTIDWNFNTVILNHYNDTSEEIVTKEDGIISCTVTSLEELPQGFLYITRASSLDNFKKWELIACLKNTGKLEEYFSDSTVGSLVKYQYACQYRIKKSGAWTEKKYSKYVYPNFHDILIYRQDKQLAIRYNAQIASYSAVVNRQLINTLGGKYPKFAENANMNYKKFTITGLLTAEADFNRQFYSDLNHMQEIEDYNKYMNGQYSLRNDTIADGESISLANISAMEYPNTRKITQPLARNSLHDLYPIDNWWLEREFRENALSWLNDGEPKLFRSMTEGNLIVMLIDISLTPNSQLGRRTYNISMTAYEVGDGYSLETLSSLGIVNVPNQYEDSIKADSSSSSDDSNEEEERIIENTIGQFWKIGGFNRIQLIYDLKNTVDASLEQYTLDDYYNSIFYQGSNGNYKVTNDSYRLWDVKIQFETQPQWYINTSLTNTPDWTLVSSQNLKDLENNNLNASVKNSLPYAILGYKLLIKDIEGQEKTILIGEKGYYQIPSDIVIKDIQLFDEAIATIDYKLSYQREYDETSLPMEASISEKIVGQLSGRWNVNQTISDLIKNKYDYIFKDHTLKTGYKGVKEKQYFDKITAIGFDGTPYTTLKIKFEGDENSSEFLVGRTGVYNLMTDYPIEEMVFLGRRMFRKEISKYGNITSYILDSSVASYKLTSNDNLAWDQIGYQDSPTEAIITINGKISTIETKQIARNWVSESNEAPYDSVKDISNPIEGTIYGVWDESGNTTLMLYIQNQWVEVSLIIANDEVIISLIENTKFLQKQKYYLDEWEFSLDNSADNSYEENEFLYWYKYNYGITKNKVYINETTDINHYVFNLNEEKRIPAIDGYASTDDIEDPEYNKIYGIQNGESKIYKIYYIDNNWYNVQFLDDNQSLILAEVPVYGMVNYRGNLVRIKYV